MVLAVWVTLITAICLQVVLGTDNGLAYASDRYHTEVSASDVIANIEKAPDSLVQSELIPLSISYAPLVRQAVPVARAHRLSLFATDAVATYRSEGLFSEFRTLQTKVVRPTNEAELKGTALVDATATDKMGVTRVEFHVTGSALHDAPVGSAFLTYYGWFLYWNTARVPNGIYTLQSVAYSSDAKAVHSRGIVVTVDN